MSAINKKNTALQKESSTKINKKEQAVIEILTFRKNFNDILGLIENNSYSNTDFYIDEENALKSMLDSEKIAEFPEDLYQANVQLTEKQAIALAKRATILQQELEDIIKSAISKALTNYKNVINTKKYKGGIGGTTFLAHIVYILAKKFGKKILLVDTDIIHRTIGNAERIFQQYNKTKRKKGTVAATPEMLKNANISEIDHGIDSRMRFLYFLNSSDEKKLPGVDIFRCQKLIPDDIPSNNTFTYNSLLAMFSLFVAFDRDTRDYDYIFMDNGQESTLIEDYTSYFIKNQIIFAHIQDRDIDYFIKNFETETSGFLELYKETKKHFEIGPTQHNATIIITAENEAENESLTFLENNKKRFKEYLKKQGNISNIKEIVFLPFADAISSRTDKVNKKDGYATSTLIYAKGKKYQKLAKNYMTVVENFAKKLATNNNRGRR